MTCMREPLTVHPNQATACALPHAMFNLFKKSSDRERLEKVYKKLLEESFRLSTSNRKASDLKRAEAEEVLKRIEALPR